MFQEFINDIKKLRPRKLSVDQIQLMFEVLCGMAGRISEVLNLEPGDILTNGMIRLREAKGGWKRCDCSKWKYRPTTLVYSDKSCQRCKGLGKFRVIQDAWMPDHIFFRLQDLAAKTEAGKKLFPITSRQALRYVNDLAGGRTHTMRHSWLTWMVTSGKFDIRDVMQKARHTSLVVTDRYIQRNNDVTREKEKDFASEFI